MAILKVADAGLPVGDVIGSTGSARRVTKIGGLSTAVGYLRAQADQGAKLAESKQIAADSTPENKAMMGLITKNSDANQKTRSGGLPGGRRKASDY